MRRWRDRKSTRENCKNQKKKIRKEREREERKRVEGEAKSRLLKEDQALK